MNDTIYRADAIEAVKETLSGNVYWDYVCDAVDALSALPSAKPTGELISKADAVELLTEIVFDEPPCFDSETLCRLYAEEQINTLPSADIAETEPIVIRSRTLLPTKDFKEWAKRIREVNPNAAVIPCDAEVASAEAEPKGVLQGYCKGADCKWWNPQLNGCNRCVMIQDEYTHPSAEAVQGDGKMIPIELKKRYPHSRDEDITDAFIRGYKAHGEAVQGWIPCGERLPSKSGDYLATIPLDADETYTEVLTFHNGRFYEDDDEWGATYHDDVIAWMPLPTPYKGGDSE